MSLRKMIVQYVGSTLFLSPFEREVTRIVERNYEADAWKWYAPITCCENCCYYEQDIEGYEHWCHAHGHATNPRGYCAWGERKEGGE